MREILFRGKRTDTGEWVEGYFAKSFKEPFISIIIDDGFHYEVNPDTVGQYTGLTDKNGKKIFEGDILAYRALYSLPVKKRQVVFEKGGFYCKGLIGVPFLSKFADEMEVIGNIHDNQELLQP